MKIGFESKFMDGSEFIALFVKEIFTAKFWRKEAICKSAQHNIELNNFNNL